MKFLAAICMLPCIAGAVPITGASLPFNGLITGEQVLNYYAGGLGSLGSGPGPAYGISFSSGLVISSAILISGPSALVSATSVTMNLDSPWAGLISFYFDGFGSLSFYSGLNGTGSLVRNYALSPAPFFPVSFVPGAFQSAVFTPTIAPNNVMRLDSILLQAVATPEPSTTMTILAGLLFVTGLRVRRSMVNRLRAA